MSDHPIQGLMTAAMENLKAMVDVNTIIGDPVETPDGSVILTVSKVGFGFAAGGSEFVIDSPQGGTQGQAKQPFGGGSGGGVSITPIAFLIVGSHGIKMLHLDQGTHLIEKVMDLAPTVVDKIQSIMNSQQNKQNQQSQENKQNKQNQQNKQNKQNEQDIQDLGL
jgi:sporulation protein YtfJ